MAQLTVKCYPEHNYPIAINGIESGFNTPHTFDLAAGTYTVETLVPAIGNSYWKVYEWLDSNGNLLASTESIDIELSADTTIIAILKLVHVIPPIVILLLLGIPFALAIGWTYFKQRVVGYKIVK